MKGSNLLSLKVVSILSGVLILIAAILIIYPDTRQFLNTNEGAIVSLLTLLLVILYFGQSYLFHQQVALENTPHVEIQKTEVEGSEVTVWLSNLGNGVATNIVLRTEIQFSGGESFEPDTKSLSMRKIGDSGDKKKQVGNSLKPGSQNVRFVGEPVVGLRKAGEPVAYHLDSATQQLSGDGVEEIEIEFFITHSDLLKNESSRSIFRDSYVVELSGEMMDLEELKSVARRPWEPI